MNYWTENDSLCELCGTPFVDNADRGEYFDPNGDDQSYIVHPRCGRARGWEDARG